MVPEIERKAAEDSDIWLYEFPADHLFILADIIYLPKLRLKLL